MLDVRALTERRFGGSVVVNILAMFAIMGNAVILTQYLQSVLGFSPLAAALWSLVPSVVVGAAAPVSAMLAPRLGRPVVMAGGFVVSVVGFVMISRVDEASALWLVLLAAGLVSGGLVAVLSLITDYVVGVAPAERAGSVAGLVETSSELGGALGLALLGSVLAAVYRTQADLLMPAGLPAPAAAEAGQTLAGAVAVSEQLPGALGQAVMEAGRAAYTAAMHTAGLTAAGVLVLAAVVTLVMLRGTDRQPVAADAESVDA
jgi:DHA2 family multidrug resistance protein-like MFS transporter